MLLMDAGPISRWLVMASRKPGMPRCCLPCTQSEASPAAWARGMERRLLRRQGICHDETAQCPCLTGSQFQPSGRPATQSCKSGTEYYNVASHAPVCARGFKLAAPERLLIARETPSSSPNWHVQQTSQYMCTCRQGRQLSREAFT